MRIVVVLAALALLAGCGDDDEQAAAPALADLTVTVDDGAKTKTTTVRCDSEADSATCRALSALDRDAFAPTPGDRACTEIYGGPERATVTGTLRGETIDARFSRTNGCEIARWDAAKKLLAAAG
jgi:hypothetical protein